MTTQISYVNYALREMKELYGRSPVSDFGPLALRAIQQRLVDERKFYRKTVNSITQQVRRVFKWGASLEMIPAEIYQALATVPGLRTGRTKAKESKPVLPVDESLVDATLPYLSPVVADMVRFQRLTGCRPGEVCQLRPMDLDHTGEVWQYRPESHKTQHHGRERIIFIGPKAQAMLLPYLARDAAAYCFTPAESELGRKAEMRAKRKSKVQPSQKSRKKPGHAPQFHECYTNDTYAKAIRRAVAHANREIKRDAEQFEIEKPTLLANWAPNRLRHSCGTDVRRQYGLEAAQVVLGHSKADVTQVYAERDHVLAAEVMKKIG
jgi:integrase